MTKNKKRIFMAMDIEDLSEEEALAYSKKVRKQVRKWLARPGVVRAEAVMRVRRGDRPLDLENMKLRA